MIDIQQYFDNFYKGTSNQTFDAIKYLLKQYNNFQNEMKFIHVAGTNGKGSCVEIINNILIKQGYKVGKFITPHLIRYNERIAVNNKEITDEEMSDLIEELEPIIQKCNKENDFKISYFDLLTIIALLHYYRNNVDIVVLETGLGGLYDSTNIVSNTLVSVITSIGYDHVKLLGNTLEEITRQKAGIIKEKSNTVFFEQTDEINEIILNTCKEKSNNLYLIKKAKVENCRYDNRYQYFDYGEYKKIAVVLKGEKQIQNAAICIECMKILNKLGIVVNENSIREGLKTVIHKGRLEILNKSPLIIFDGAHNEPAILNFKTAVDGYYKDFNRVYIISILKRKNYKNMMELLLKDKEAKFIFTSGISSKKYVTKEELYNEAISYTDNKNLYMGDLESSIGELFKNKDKKTANFIVGSFYTYATVLKTLNKLQ